MLLKHVVTSFLRSDLGILLLRRSPKVGTYQGRWAGVSGYLEPSENPLQRAETEIEEELGLNSSNVSLVRPGEELRALDEEKETVWIVHPFLFETRVPNPRLDWEHSEYKWISPDELQSHATVPKLMEAFERVRWDLNDTFQSLSYAMGSLDQLSKDRVHGASFLGRRSIEILGEVARSSNAGSVDELWRELLSMTMKLRKTQPSMATIRNLTGKVLYEIDSKRQGLSSVEQFKEIAVALLEKVSKDAAEAAEDAARNSAAMMPSEGNILTHSYSSTVRKALDLAGKSKRLLTVYTTESSPGLEGRQLAKDLIGDGLSIKLIADSAVESAIPSIDLVLVGADSVLADGSVINKIGTKRIAGAAHEKRIPVHVVCETAKFSALDFLGEPSKIAETLFDVTPNKHISKIITETGSIETREVEQEIRKMLSQLYP